MKSLPPVCQNLKQRYKNILPLAPDSCVSAIGKYNYYPELLFASPKKALFGIGTVSGRFSKMDAKTNERTLVMEQKLDANRGLFRARNSVKYLL